MIQAVLELAEDLWSLRGSRRPGVDDGNPAYIMQNIILLLVPLWIRNRAANMKEQLNVRLKAGYILSRTDKGTGQAGLVKRVLPNSERGVGLPGGPQRCIDSQCYRTAEDANSVRQ